MGEKVSDVVDATDGNGIDFCRLSKGMVEAALEAFKDRKMYIADCENLRETCDELKKELQSKPTPHDYVATMTNFLDSSESERAEATFNVDNYRVTIIAERKGK